MTRARVLSYAFLIAAFCGFVYVLGATGRDDSHITFWAARAFGEHGAIVNYNGERVEQSSSLFFTLLLGATARLVHQPPESIAPIFSFAFGILTWIIAARLAFRHAPELEPWTLAIGATCLPVAYWSLSGMETTATSLLYVSFVTLAADSLAKPPTPGRRALLVAVLCALVMVRPESPLVCLLALGLTAVVSATDVDRRALRPALEALGIAGIASTLLVVFRLRTFGLPVPMPVVAKSGVASVQAKLDALRHGLAYLVRADNRFGIGPLLLVCVVGAGGFAAIATLRRRAISPDVLVTTTFAASLLAFVVSSGGDWMELGRFLVPLWPLAVVLALVGCRTVLPTPRIRVALWSTLVVFQLVSVPSYAREFSTGIPLWIAAPADRGTWMERHNGVHVRSMRFVPVLERAIADVARRKPDGRVVVLTGEMGAIPYHVAAESEARIRFIDRFGLATADVTACPSTQRLTRDAFGVRMSYGFYVDHARELAEICDLPMPDIVYDLPTFLGSTTLAKLEALGYTVARGRSPEPLGAPWLLDEPERRTPILAIRRAP